MRIIEELGQQMNQGDLEAMAAILQGIARKLDVMDSRLEAIVNGSHKGERDGKSAGRLVKERNGVEEMTTLVGSIERKRQLAQFESLCEEGSYFAYVDSFMSIANQVDLSEEDRVTMFVKGLKEGSTKLIQVLNPKTLQQAISWGRALTVDKDPYERKGMTEDMRVSSTYPVAWTNIRQEGSITGGKEGQGSRKELISRGMSLETTNGATTYLPPHRRLIKTVVDEKQTRRLCLGCDVKFTCEHQCAPRKVCPLVLEHTEVVEGEVVAELVSPKEKQKVALPLHVLHGIDVKIPKKVGCAGPRITNQRVVVAKEGKGSCEMIFGMEWLHIEEVLRGNFPNHTRELPWKGEPIILISSGMGQRQWKDRRCSSKCGESGLWMMQNCTPPPTKGGEVEQIECLAEVVSALAIDQSGSRVLSGSYYYTVRMHDFQGMNSRLASFIELEPFEGNQVHNLSWSPTSDRFLCVTGSAQAKIYGCDGLSLGELIKGNMYIRDLKNTKGHITGLTWGEWHSKTKETILTSSEDGSLRIWDVNDFKSKKQVIKPKLARSGGVAITTCTWDHEGKCIANGIGDGSVQIGNLKPGWESRPDIYIEKAHSEDITRLKFSSDGKNFLSRSFDGSLKVWNLRQMKMPFTVFEELSNNYAQTNFAFRPDEQLILTETFVAKASTISGLLCLFDLAKLELVSKIEIFTNNSLLQAGTHVLYDPIISERGALVCVASAPRKKSVDDFELQHAIHNPHVLLLFKDQPSRKHQREKILKDPLKSHKPELPMTGPGHGGRAGTSKGSLLTQYLLKQGGMLKEPSIIVSDSAKVYSGVGSTRLVKAASSRTVSVDLKLNAETKNPMLTAAGTVTTAAIADRMLRPKEDRNLAIVLGSLPARSKTFMGATLTRYLHWLGHDTKHFNVGKYRRLEHGSTQSADFFQVDNQDGREARNEIVAEAMEDMISWIQEKGHVGIFEATNNKGRRKGDSRGVIKVLVLWQNGDSQDATWKYVFNLQAKIHTTPLRTRVFLRGGY